MNMEINNDCVYPAITILSHGPKALVELFQHLVIRLRCIGGLKGLIEMSTKDAKNCLFNFGAENIEIFRVLYELLYIRDPLLNIEAIANAFNKKIENRLVNCEPGHLFMARYIDLEHFVPKYYQLLAAEDSPNLIDLVEAWLIDLRFGIHTTDPSTIFDMIVNEGDGNYDADEDEVLARFIVNSDLSATLMEIPQAMLLRARLITVTNIIIADYPK